jgi:hypothetical protein
MSVNKKIFQVMRHEMMKMCLYYPRNLNGFSAFYQIS